MQRQVRFHLYSGCTCYSVRFFVLFRIAYTKILGYSRPENRPRLISSNSSEHRHASRRRLCPVSWRSVILCNSGCSRDCSTVYKTKFRNNNKTKIKQNRISFLSFALRNLRYRNEYNTLNTIHSFIFYNMFRPFMLAINRYNHDNINGQVYWGRVCYNIINRWHRAVCIAYN